MRIEAGDITLRPWRVGDEDALVRYADNPNIARNLCDVFPEPYTRVEADQWLTLCAEEDPVRSFAIEQGGDAIGGVGFTQKGDVYARTRSIGYWLAEPFWGRGIATRAVVALVPHCFSKPEIIRLEAIVFGWNPASGRVLEKAGFTRECTQKDAICKHGEITDCHVYRLLRAEWRDRR